MNIDSNLLNGEREVNGSHRLGNRKSWDPGVGDRAFIALLRSQNVEVKGGEVF
jgi:hypothetical protein